MKKTLLYLLAAVMMLMGATACKTSKKIGGKNIDSPKEEFRGAWVQTVFQDSRYNKSPEQCRQYMDNLVETLYRTGFNAVIFQVRPEGDAFYQSSLEPWSRFLTGAQGKAPTEHWDPMSYMIDCCHRRGMEFHAWINPYRAYASKSFNLASNHLYRQRPDLFFKYDNKLYFNPGYPETRQHIRDVVKDIVTRYDVDAIHMDDYFYPYPVAGESINDLHAYQTYGSQWGFDANSATDLHNFRRRCVDVLIRYVHDDIKAIKPWVRFGVSPFGIYRNQGSWAKGSATNGTQCYDDLYADVLLWAQNGWIDYIVPQLYWARGNKAADYEILVDWWAENVPPTCQLYIGQSIEKSLDNGQSLATSNYEMTAKMKQARNTKNVKGNCFWYAYQIEDNQYNVRDYLSQTVFKNPAKVPGVNVVKAKKPGKVTNLDGQVCSVRGGGYAMKLSWMPAKGAVRHYKIYRSEKGSKYIQRELCGTTTDNEYLDYGVENHHSYNYYVVPVGADNTEAKAARKNFTLNLK